MNLAKTQAQWSKLFREMGVFMAPIKLLRENARKFDSSRNRHQWTEENNVNGFTSGWVLTGTKIGGLSNVTNAIGNTDEGGELYVRIADETPGAGQAQVSLYRKTGAGGGDLVARGSGNDNTTITLTAQNSSGLSGTVAIVVVTASEADDKHRLRAFPDFQVRALALFDGTEPEHAAELAAFNDACLSTQGSQNDSVAAWKTALAIAFATRVKKFIRSGGKLIDLGIRNVNGVISTVFSGALVDMSADMVDELTAAAQTVIRNLMAAVAVVFDANNQGQGAMVTPTMTEAAVAGLIAAVCVDDTVGSEKFLLTQTVDLTGAVLSAKSVLQINQAFSDPNLGIQAATLTRTLSLSVGSTNDFGAGATWSIAGENPNNAPGGNIFLKVVIGANDITKWKVQGFSLASRLAANQVFDSAEVAANTAATLIATNGSGITGTGKSGTAPTANNTGTLNLQTFQVKNSNKGVADKFTWNVTQTSAGEFQDLLRLLFAYFLNSAPSGAQTIEDRYVSAGTFTAYTVRDV